MARSEYDTNILSKRVCCKAFCLLSIYIIINSMTNTVINIKYSLQF